MKAQSLWNEQTARAPVDSTSWAPNSSNQSTDSSEAPIKHTRGITEGTFLIPEPLACVSLLLPAVCHVWMIGHIITSEYLKVKHAEDMMNLAKDQIHNIVYIQPKACFTLHVIFDNSVEIPYKPIHQLSFAMRRLWININYYFPLKMTHKHLLFSKCDWMQMI